MTEDQVTETPMETPMEEAAVVEIFRTIVVPAAEQALAQSIAAEYPGGAGMFTTGCSPSGLLPATDYISSGMMGEDIVEALGTALVDEDISEEPPFVALERLGLQLVSEPEDAA
jgi:hypothetical protein